MLKWKDFIQTGFRHVKHIKLYKFFFLPSSYIVEIIQEYDPDVSLPAIIENYRPLLESIPTEWKECVKVFHNTAFHADFCVNQSVLNFSVHLL